MRLAIEQEFHVGQTEPERFDILLYLRRRPGKPGVEENVAGAARDEERRDLIRANVINIVDHPEWLDRLVRFSIALALLGEHRAGKSYRCEKSKYQLRHE